jgi:O-antigen ligase
MSSPLRRLGFYILLVLLFVRFGMVHELLSLYSGVEANVLDVLGIPCIVCMLLSGGMRRALHFRAAYYWLALAGWMTLAIPFSTWHGGSFHVVFAYLRTGLVMVFAIVGLVMSWKECVQMMYALALGAVVNVVTTFISSVRGQDERVALSLRGASIGNANDLAAHLLLVLCFVLFVALVKKQNWVVRLIAIIALCVGLYDVLSTGSRGALVALILGGVYTMTQAPARVRFAVLIVVPIGMVLIAGLLPRDTLNRYLSLVSSSVDDPQAAASADERTYLLQTSALLSLTHPLFGVGPGEFEDQEAEFAKENRRRASWLVPHNTYTQLSSESGIPALVFLVAALGSSFLVLRGTYEKARSRSNPEFRSIMAVSFCVLLAMVLFCGAIFFLSFAYHFYLPTITGIALAVSQAAKSEFNKQEWAATAVSSL